MGALGLLSLMGKILAFSLCENFFRKNHGQPVLEQLYVCLPSRNSELADRILPGAIRINVGWFFGTSDHTRICIAKWFHGKCPLRRCDFRGSANFFSRCD